MLFRSSLSAGALSGSQLGFIKDKSTETAVHSLVGHTEKLYDARNILW